MNASEKLLLSAAVAGLVGTAMTAGSASAAAKKAKTKAKAIKMEVVHCYGVNACKGKGECGGKGHDCAGLNGCRGQGWLSVPEKSCKATASALHAAPEKGHENDTGSTTPLPESDAAPAKG